MVAQSFTKRTATTDKFRPDSSARLQEGTIGSSLEERMRFVVSAGADESQKTDQSTIDESFEQFSQKRADHFSSCTYDPMIDCHVKSNQTHRQFS